MENQQFLQPVFAHLEPRQHIRKCWHVENIVFWQQFLFTIFYVFLSRLCWSHWTVTLFTSSVMAPLAISPSSFGCILEHHQVPSSKCEKSLEGKNSPFGKAWIRTGDIHSSRLKTAHQQLTMWRQRNEMPPALQGWSQVLPQTCGKGNKHYLVAKVTAPHRIAIANEIFGDQYSWGQNEREGRWKFDVRHAIES